MPRIIRFLLICLFGVPSLHSQIEVKSAFVPTEISSVRIHAKMQQSDFEMNLSVAIKEVEKVRATLHRYPSPVRITAYYLDGSVYLIENGPGKGSLRKLEDTEAARQLLELIAFCPSRFFNENDQPLLKTELLKTYNFELLRKPVEEATNETDQKGPLLGITLVSKETGSALHRIIFDEDASEANDSRSRDFTIYNEESGIRSQIKIESIEDNPGLPDFLFQLPKSN